MNLEKWEDASINKFLLIILFAFVVISGLLLINSFHGDPSIYFIYARNIANLDFFSYNPGEFSSGSTSPLWAIILSPSFLLPNSILIIKIFCLILTIFAFFIAYRAAINITGSKLGSTLGLIFLIYYALIPCLLCYETPLTIILLSILLIINKKIISGESKAGSFIWLCIIWSLIPLSRPDAIAVVIADALLLMFFKRHESKKLFIFILIFSIALLPLALYFTYSSLQTGMASNSSYCRAFALQETAKQFMGISFSLESILALLSYPMILFLIIIVWELSQKYALYRKNSKQSPNARNTAKSVIEQDYFFVLLAFLISGAYFVSITVISPINSMDRYIIPIIPFIIVAIAKPLENLFIKFKANNWIMLTFFLILFILIPFGKLAGIVAKEWSNHFDFETITEKNIIDYVNNIAEPNSFLLSYEVQDRYYLRDDIDILSLDGITDGKVAPYLSNSRIDQFLKKYKPNYWLANDAVYYRPYLQKSILKNVLDSMTFLKKDTIRIADITFIKIYTNPEPERQSFAHSKYLFKIEYPK